MKTASFVAATFVTVALSGAAEYRPPAGTALYFPFDTPETALASFGAIRATLGAGEGQVRFVPAGRTGGCLGFDGGAKLRLPGVPAELATGANPYTVAAWIRADADCSPRGGWISYGDRVDGGYGNSFRLNGKDGVQNYWNAQDLTAKMPGVGDGAWHHVAGTFDGTTRELFYDGRSVARAEGKPRIGRTIFEIGGTMFDSGFKGLIDEVLVAGRAFSADEIAALAETGVARAGVRAVTAADGEAVLVDGAFVKPLNKPVALDAATVKAEGWTMTFDFSADGLARPTTLVDIPGAVTVSYRLAGTNPALHQLDTQFGNYLNFRLKDGTCPVLEASIAGERSVLGVPLGALKKPDGVHRVTIRRGADAHWFLTVDEGYDEDGLRAKEIAWPDAAKFARVSDRVKDLIVKAPAVARPHEPDARPITRPIQFWTPDGHNTWVGDVVVGVFKGRLHVFYLLDRRHHASKGGAGGHYFAHVSTTDLVHWDEHPTAIGLDAWWQTLGTGTPFEWNGKFCLAYGLHTTRFMPSAETTEPFLKKYFEEHGDTGVFDFAELKGYPLGGAYAESTDGIHFTRVNKLIHSAQNPTVYNRADGKLGFVNSYGGIHGMYCSEKDPWGWKLVDDQIPISGDCPCEFEWHGHHYLLQGFVHMAYNPDGAPGNWTDWSQTGDDIYDGLCVPMVAPWPSDRRLIAGWIVHPQGWGGWLALHELVQYPDGKLGSKWIPEAQPPGEQLTLKAGANESVAVRFTGERETLEFRVDARLARAQIANVNADGSVTRCVTNAERHRAGSNAKLRDRNGAPGHAQEYAIERIRGLDRSYEVRLAAFYDAKADVTLFDAEIAGQRTMIWKRSGKFAVAQ